jgi:hypothetical protein
MQSKHHKRARALFGAVLAGLGLSFSAALQSCSGGGGAGDSRNIGPFELTLVSTGLGQIYPYRIAELDSFGLPSSTILNVSTEAQLNANMTADNGLLPVATWGTTATLPNSAAGNQFLMMRFSHDLNPSSILSDLPGNQTNSGLTGALQLLIYDPGTEVQTTIKGRGFVGGYSYYDDPGDLRVRPGPYAGRRRGRRRQRLGRGQPRERFPRSASTATRISSRPRPLSSSPMTMITSTRTRPSCSRRRPARSSA